MGKNKKKEDSLEYDLIDPKRISYSVDKTDKYLGNNRYKRKDGSTYTRYKLAEVTSKNEATKAYNRRRSLDNTKETMIKNSENITKKYGSKWRNMFIFNDDILNPLRSIKSYFTIDDNYRYIDLSNKRVKHIKDNNIYDEILFNDFVEHNNNNNIRKAKDFKNTTDTLIGDKKIPLSNMPYFIGVENGKLRIDKVNGFSDNTIIVPVRTKNREKVKEIINNEYIHYDNKNILYKKYPPATIGQQLANLFTFGYYTPREMTKEYIKNMLDYGNYLNDKKIGIPKKLNRYSLVTTTGDTIPYDISLKFTNKHIFSDEKGNAIFINNYANSSQLQKKELNEELKRTPRYIFTPDNGRYGYTIKNTSRNAYTNILDDADKMFIIGYNNKKYE